MNKKISSRLSELSFLKKDLKKLEKFLKDFTGTTDSVLNKAVSNTLVAGGKRIRPLLFFICARNKDYDIDYLLPAAAAIEIIHTASLVHDDIIDKSILRRGKRTIHDTYDKDTAKFVGDFLFTHTFSLLNSYHNKRILIEMSEAAKCLVKGEFDQLNTKRDLYQSEDVYFEKINEKTSSLFKVSCVIGGILSKVDEVTIESMRRFGEYVGISFQINDDLIDIDINSTSKEEGKPVGKDFKQGDITLPFIFAMQDKKVKDRIESFIEKSVLSDKELKEILEIVYSTDAIDRTKQKFFYYMEKARRTLEFIKGKERCTCLLRLCDIIEQRAGLGK